MSHDPIEAIMQILELLKEFAPDDQKKILFSVIKVAQALDVQQGETT